MNLDKSDAYNNICIAGIGGVGGYIGGNIALNITGNYKDKRNVIFISRGENLGVIKKKGLTVKLWEAEPFTCIPNIVTDRISELPHINLLIAAVKGYDLEAIMNSLREKITDETVIIPLLNGVGNEEKIRGITGKGIILPSCIYISSKIEEPGFVKMMGSIAKIISGPDPENPEYDSKEIINFFKSMGMKFIWEENPFLSIWGKFIFIAPASLITAAERITINEILDSPEHENGFKGMMAEIRKIAEKKGIMLPSDAEEYSLKVVKNIDRNAKTSFLLDVEKGKEKEKTEIDAFGYNILRMGKETGVDVPFTEKYLEKIKF